METNQKLDALRKAMKARKIDVYYIPNGDDHLSDEYTADYFKSMSFMSGFNGESGCLIVTKDWAGQWADGRYFTQAEKELAGSEIELMRMGQEGVPAAMDFLVEHTPKGGTLGFDGRMVSVATYEMLKRRMKDVRLYGKEDLVSDIWAEDRPSMPEDKIFVLEKKYTGEDAKSKIARVREEMKKKQADVLLLTALEDPCWLLNLRGNDIACTPVIYAYAVVTTNQLYYYIDPAKVTEKVKVYLEERGVTLRPYDALGDDLEKYHGKNIWVSLSGLNTDLFECIAKDNYFITEPSPITLFRAVKNDIEIKNTKNAHIKDGVAMVKFIRWIKENVGKMDLDEVKAQNYLYDLRKQGKLYIEPSFPTICAYQANGAMMHYSATEDNYAKIKNRGFLLVDSGGTYKDGTTDITRTIALNKLTNEEKKLYTKVLQGHLALSRAKFLQGTAGNNLDILARRPLWDMDIDYQCGTGHGVGHVMSVHEGPHSIRWGIATTARPAVALVPGMIVTNEPGVYIPHKLGIRIENEMLVVKGNKNFYGQFLGFETITYCPYDLDAIDPKYLEEEDIKQINSYHQMVYDTLAPYLDAKDKSWLKKATKRIVK